MADEQFLLLIHTDEDMLINLSQVRMISDFETGEHCLLHFSEDHVIKVIGEEAGQLIRRFLERAITLSGTPARQYFPSEG